MLKLLSGKRPSPSLKLKFDFTVIIIIMLTVASCYESISLADFLGSSITAHTCTCIHVPPQTVIDSIVSIVMVAHPLKLMVVVQCTMYCACIYYVESISL